MKRFFMALAIILFIISGCSGGKKDGVKDEGIITVDVTKTYPKKDLVLQDFMDVEYIALETNDEFLNTGDVMDVGKELVLVTNYRNGDIFLYNRSGKALRKINREGQGSEEYTRLSEVILDEEKSELFVYSRSSKKNIVYDLSGNFKRSFDINDNGGIINIYKYEKENFIHNEVIFNLYNDNAQEEKNAESFYIISKQDGSVVKEIKIPFIKEKSPAIIKRDGEMIIVSFLNITSIISNNGNTYITPISSDTVFRYLPDHNMEPFIVRTPSIQSMETEVYLFPTILTDQYYFMESARKEKDSPRINLLYDRKEKAIYEYTVNNSDYTDRIESFSETVINDEIAMYAKFEAFELIEANEQGKLKGKLKEIAEGLDEDDNPVIMLAKYKR